MYHAAVDPLLRSDEVSSQSVYHALSTKFILIVHICAIPNIAK